MIEIVKCGLELVRDEHEQQPVPRQLPREPARGIVILNQMKIPTQ